MARDTNFELRNASIYQIFTRQYSDNGDFKGIIENLGTIRDLGVDYIYLLPFYPIGIKDRKGDIGSPYAIYDYVKIDESHGTIEDFKLLVNKAHEHGLKVMIDIVFNHTSRDSVLTVEHPEWFFRKSNGELANRVGDWTDIADLKTDLPEVQDYLISVLKYWGEIVDGFRCDVASLLPLDFWLKARLEVKKINPNLIWLAESVDKGFVKYLRDIGYDALSDSEVFQAFDIAYDYDNFDYLNGLINGNVTLEMFLKETWKQEAIFPKNYVKLRFLENHDQDRIAYKVQDEVKLKHITALNFFLRGAMMIYAGQENKNIHKPDLFTIDKVEFIPSNYREFIRRLIEIKKHPIFAFGSFEYIVHNQVATITYTLKNEKIYGIFNLTNERFTPTDLPDGLYMNLINNEIIPIVNHVINLTSEPIIILVNKK
ncbi:alpha-amylase family glycosyl hydrolase [Acholeplasma hippikon]|uniref:Cyclomaltodextrinase n=1 Tax=Acholeplasma hippikon TaxID=264636 RepID=A0A449BIR1_9MOLU|nr:alpha-amylase family glycosyl hydrolase [Acholeplasma hippikon]VEU82345.1 Cyclomaltodextrinase [Acholeplasma hippikon]